MHTTGAPVSQNPCIQTTWSLGEAVWTNEPDKPVIGVKVTDVRVHLSHPYIGFHFRLHVL
jgi:hypothetical protein